MKRKSEFGRERDEALLRAYKEVVMEVDYIELDDVCVRVANKPSPRFWVSEERAAEVIGKMLRGGSVEGMNRMRRAMYLELYTRCMRLLEGGASLKDAVFTVVNSPAPSFYYEPASIKVMLWRAKHKR